jgi:hypothetical protein
MKVKQAIRLSQLILNDGEGGCGSGAGGFKPGNTCAKGGGGGGVKADEGTVVGKTAGGLDTIQDTTGKGIKAGKISEVVSELKEGDDVMVVFTSGKSMTGKVTGFGSLKGTSTKAARIEATEGDLGTGEKVIGPHQSLHSMTWGKDRFSGSMDRSSPAKRVGKGITPFKEKPVSRIPPRPRREG